MFHSSEPGILGFNTGEGYGHLPAWYAIPNKKNRGRTSRRFQSANVESSASEFGSVSSGGKESCAESDIPYIY